jgi:hypothetical protein
MFVGMLPGSDPGLASEIVLVSAHYDHLGKDSHGRICPGAGDDASGVAAMLETARQLTQRGPKPDRTICFAAFDCEEKMLFGSFAFTCRKDVQEAKIVAVVNLDILGRDFLDVVHNNLFLAGSEHYPEIRKQVRQFGDQAGMRVLPVGTDLIGPRGDHAAFESRPIPCLFFSSGLYRDYHKPTDTADKLDYEALGRSARTVVATVTALAAGPAFQRTEKTTDAESDELQAVTTVMTEVSRDCARAGVTPEQVAGFSKLAQEAENLLKSGQYDQKKRKEFIVGAAGILAPSLLDMEEFGGKMPDSGKATAVAGLQYMQQFYLKHRIELLESYRKFVAHILEYRPGPFRGMPAFEYELYPVEDEDIHLADLGDGRWALDVLLSPVTLRAEARRSKWLIESFSFVLGVGLDGINIEGTREEITDLCPLRLRQEQANAVRSQGLRKVLGRVTGTEPTTEFKKLLAQRLQRGGFKSEADWLAFCIGSGIPPLALEAISTDAKDEHGAIRQALCQVIVDRSQRGDVRAQAIDWLRPGRNREVLLTLCSVVQDPSPALTRDCWAINRDDYYFADRLEVKTLRSECERQIRNFPNFSKSVGDVALARLKRATGKDFGKDSARWRAWVERNAGR